MGFLDRVYHVLTGLEGAVQAPFGLVKDLATAPFKDDDEFDGFINTLYRRTVARGGQVFGNVLGPEEGLGAGIGALPAGIRKPARSVIQPVLSGFETAYREGVSEPISAALTASSLADAPGGGGLGGLFRGSNWREGYRIAQHRSPGQAFALAVGTKDINDEAEVAKYMASDSYAIISGTTDAVFRMTLDPSILAGKAATAARVKYLVRPIRSAEDIDRAMESARYSHFRETAMAKDSATEIRHQFFPEHAHGGVIATILKDAKNPEEFDAAMRAMMGDRAALEALDADKVTLANKIRRLADERDLSASPDLTVVTPGPTASEMRAAGFHAGDEMQEGFDRLGSLLQADRTVPVAYDRATQLQREINDLYPAVDRLTRREAAFQSIVAVPRVSRTGQLRASVTRSDWYQESALAAPLRVAFNMKPQNLVNVESQAGDVQIARMTTKAGMAQDSADALRARFMAATTPGDRQAVVVAAEEASVNTIARKAGMTVSDIEDVLTEAGRRRNTAAQMLKGRVYDGEGRSRLTVLDEEGVTHEIPLLVSQEANVLPIVDLDEVQRAASRLGQFRLRHPATDIPEELLNSFYKLWKPSVLIRVGWPIRVLGDEQLRIIAKVGAMAQLKNLRTGIANKIEDIGTDIPKDLAMPGQRMFSVLDYDMQGAFGAPGDAANIYKNLASSRAAFDRFFGRDEEGILTGLREHSGEWRSIAPDHPDYANAWEHAVNLQIGNDSMARQFLLGRTVEDVTEWLTHHPDGIRYARRIPARAANPRRWAETVAEQVDSYLGGSDELMDAALGLHAQARDLARVFPDPSTRPIVHGEVLAQTLGTSVVSQALHKTVDIAYAALGSKPSDILSRHPFFDTMYRAEAERRVKLLAGQEGGRLSEETLRNVEKGAREYALGETKRLLYDLAEQSDLAGMLKFFMPFYSAWQEVTTRWAGLAVENPAFIARARQVWRAPNAAGLVDKDPDTGEEYITLRIPEWVAKASDRLPFIGGALSSQGGVRFNKNSFSLATQGIPGFGPVVQVPVNEVVKNRPDLESAVGFILPFGSTQETMDLLLPATAKRIKTRSEGEENRLYFNSLMRIYWDKVTDYNLGKRTDKPTYSEAKKETDAFYNLRTVASFVLPAAPTFQSPYQLYIDAYRALREKDPTTADEVFLDTYGPEYFALTQSLSKSMDGVPPTLEGFMARKKYRDLIEADPELGGLIVGAEGAGEFSRAVYDYQLAHKVAPGSADSQRQRPSFGEAAGAPDVRLGWIEYGKLMDLIEAERVQRGLPNLHVKAAGDLAVIKRAATTALAEKHPQWWAKFNERDDLKTERRLDGMRAIVANRQLAQREDIRGLALYLKARDAIAAELSKRPAVTLTAQSNADLAGVWNAITGKLVESNLAFSQLYYRFLEHVVPVGTKEVAA